MFFSLGFKLLDIPLISNSCLSLDLGSFLPPAGCLILASVDFTYLWYMRVLQNQNRCVEWSVYLGVRKVLKWMHSFLKLDVFSLNCLKHPHTEFHFFCTKINLIFNSMFPHTFWSLLNKCTREPSFTKRNFGCLINRYWLPSMHPVLCKRL